MGLRLATSARNASVQGIGDLFDAHATLPGKIKVYTGSQPANPNTAATGTLLATFTLADPAFDAPASGTRALDATPVLEDVGDADGIAGWFRGLDGGDNAVCDGTVTATGGGGNLELNTINISIGLIVRITGGSMTQPVGS